AGGRARRASGHRVTRPLTTRWKTPGSGLDAQVKIGVAATLPQRGVGPSVRRPTFVYGGLEEQNMTTTNIDVATTDVATDVDAVFIDTQVAAGDRATDAGLLHYWKAGRRLLDVKKRLGHGEFGPWVRDKLNTHRRRCQQLMKWAKTWDSKAQLLPRAINR